MPRLSLFSFGRHVGTLAESGTLSISGDRVYVQSEIIYIDTPPVLSELWIGTTAENAIPLQDVTSSFTQHRWLVEGYFVPQSEA